MDTKFLMIASAIFYGLIGFGLTFTPNEISEYLNVDAKEITILVFQILGAVYLGFGMLNWMTKHNLIGGIYSRPLIIGNLVHFLVGSLALIKMVEYSGAFSLILVLTIIFSVFALWFGYVFITNPAKVNMKN